ncbi:MAG: alpha-amylase/4-alpha-glucanotransferase domain-containing protein [Spirochaetota bacterium]
MDCNFIFCLHNHQPVGNFDHVFEWAYKDCYRKTLDLLYQYPEFKFAIHNTGSLLEWIEQHDPSYCDMLAHMVQRGQVEIIGGGFYEPIFSIISEDDIHGHISLMQSFCKKRFNVEPTGFWTAERVWDPDIPQLVYDFKLQYTLLDDIHFRYAGIPESGLYGYYITERLLKPLRVFPIDKFLRYSIPFKLPHETVDYFKRQCDKYGNCAFVYGDDGEKFGVWPQTYQWVFEEKWLQNFIEAILKEKFIKLIHPKDYINEHPPIGRVYLTQGSYYEMSEWALPAESAGKLIMIHNEIKSAGREAEFYPFLKGGVWNNFLNKYPESNAINKRTLYLSREITNVEMKTGKDLSQVKTELYKAQCNCAYWHGLFGGIYLAHLRSALYEHILASEELMCKAKKLHGVEIVTGDFRNEGSEQIFMRNKLCSIIVNPAFGASISEFSNRSIKVNAFDVIARRKEAYHQLLSQLNEEDLNNHTVKSIHDMVTVKEKGLKRYLVYDSSRRYSCKELLFTAMPSAEALMFNTIDYIDCSHYPYTYAIHNHSIISDSLRDSLPAISKTISIHDTDPTIALHYTISSFNGVLGIECNVNMLAPHAKECHYIVEGMSAEESYLDSIGMINNITRYAIVDNNRNATFSVQASRPATLLRYPLYTVSQSDSGFEKNFQGSCVVLCFEVTNDLEFDLTLTLQ